MAASTYPTPKRSLLAQLGVVLGAIVALALLGLLSSVIVAQTAAGDAAAINHAGTLRMQAWRLASLLQQGAPRAEVDGALASFRDDLEAPALTRVLPGADGHPVRVTYSTVTVQWSLALEPLARRASSGDSQAVRDYLEVVGPFVARVDELVTGLEREAEAKIQLLRTLQGIALFATLALVFYAMYRLSTQILPPLRQLLAAVEQVRAGDLAARTRYREDDEIGLLSMTFNRMAESLQGMTHRLETLVADRTARLTQSNRALQLLYEGARRLGREAPAVADFQEVLEHLTAVLDVGPASLCLTRPGHRQPYRQLVAAGPLAGNGPAVPSCPPPPHGESGVFDLRLSEAGHRYGTLRIAHPPGRPLAGWQIRLAESIAGQFAGALGQREREAERRRLALAEERAVIARELHDSLAQSLSYLRIQTTRMQAALEEDGREEARAVLEELRTGLADAYRQLRELLDTFRLRLTEGGLGAALEAAVSDSAERGGVRVSLYHAGAEPPLTANEELHLVQIAREALANVTQHAEAKHCEVRLATDAQGRLCLTVDDDGIGPPAGEPDHHYGLVIMRERAETLGGRLELTRRPEGGTRVQVCFRPQATRETEDVP
ncbi:ATP-binding protein [Spiribacter halobius]|uniref:Sensor protein n=1 Tax=Sediminicurvatus halobius TaxID=2182432 RepID=A0A2U2MWY7_9GAMM|nr:type IV pili methyl-accepting chemotaxis transducer N-terminal domain-containing protein [Spiribacter halobius]PWG61316.1 histidine kinase [Spiribacter halobius]UEX79693.1 type IV pili methyl-accepting chemotaxis transducer N-terminal domain-containing protein [Spiribacter halobius]